MCQITFKRVTPEESRIFADGEYVGDVYRHDDILREGAHYYVVSLDEGWRGPIRVDDRARIRQAAEERIRTHPPWARSARPGSRETPSRPPPPSCRAERPWGRCVGQQLPTPT